MGLEQLSPEYQAQYNALIPEIERSVRSSNNARGMFYSGQATDAEARAKADLLAKLASESAATQAQASENEKNRDTQKSIHDDEIKAGKRNALLGIISGGTGAAATLGGLAYMNKAPSQPIFQDKFGNWNTLGADGKSIVPLGGQPGAGGVGGGASAPNLFDPSAGPAFVPGAGPGFNPAASAPVAASVTAAPSMWKSAVSLPTLGAGAVGGGLGRLGAGMAGAGGQNADIGAAAGGGAGYLGGLALASKFGFSNPWAAGLGALAGSFGGGLLGNLFK